MHRFYINPECSQNDRVTLTDREAHHGLHVLRLQPGQEVELLDGQGLRLKARIQACHRTSLEAEIIHRETTPPPSRQVVLFQAILKPKAMDLLLQKATELGATRIVPLGCAHSLTKPGEAEKKLEKWRWVTIDALKQCGTTWLPELESPQSAATDNPNQPTPNLQLLASLQSNQNPRGVIDQYLAEHGASPQFVGLWIGPEGDFTPEEHARIEDRGAIPVTLGPRTLRSETAAIYGLSMIQYALEP